MKTVLITGASRGIGAATALSVAEAGYAVVVNYHRNTTAQAPCSGDLFPGRHSLPRELLLMRPAGV